MAPLASRGCRGEAVRVLAAAVPQLARWRRSVAGGSPRWGRASAAPAGGSTAGSRRPPAFQWWNFTDAGTGISSAAVPPSPLPSSASEFEDFSSDSESWYLESSDEEGAGLAAEDYVLDDDAELAAIAAASATSVRSERKRRRRENDEKKEAIASVHAHIEEERRRSEKGKEVATRAIKHELFSPATEKGKEVIVLDSDSNE